MNHDHRLRTIKDSGCLNWSPGASPHRRICHSAYLQTTYLDQLFPHPQGSHEPLTNYTRALFMALRNRVDMKLQEPVTQPPVP